MASSHIARITAGGVSDRRIAHSLYGYCTTAADTAVKVVNLYTGSSTTADGTWSSNDLFDGLTIKVRFQYSNTASNPTLNVNGSGAKTIYRYGTNAPGVTASNSWQDEEVITFTYDKLLNSSGCWVMDKGGSNSLKNILDGSSTGSVRTISSLEESSTYSMGNYTFTEGYNTKASGTASHAEGSASTASGNYSHVEGYNTIASGQSAHAEGTNTQATKISSHAEGHYTIANGDYQHVEGKYNVASTAYAHIVGNGTSSTRSNAYTLDWSGNGTYAGKVTAGLDAENPMDLVTLQQLEEAVPSSLAAYYTTLGDGTTTSFTITHNLNNEKIVVSINITDSNNNTYMATNSTVGEASRISYVVDITSLDTISIKFSSAPLANGATVSIVSTHAFEEAIDNLLVLDS